MKLQKQKDLLILAVVLVGASFLPTHPISSSGLTLSVVLFGEPDIFVPGLGLNTELSISRSLGLFAGGVYVLSGTWGLTTGVSWHPSRQLALYLQALLLFDVVDGFVPQEGLKLDQDGAYTQKGFGDWWGAVLLLPREQNPEGRSIVAVARGDHCVNCGTKADEISSWIGRAVELAPSLQEDHEADMGVVSFAFTNPNADVASVLERLRQDHKDSSVPIIVAWWENGQVRYECIGQGCSNLSWQEQERIACNQLGLAAGCAGPPQESQTFNTDPQTPNGDPNPITIGSPPPPDSSSFCQGQICII